MKKLAFTLASVAAVCACGLVIDPDELVEGNATPIGNVEAGTDASGGGNDTGAPDAGRDGNALEVPECVPARPATTGAKGPYAVVTVTKGAPVSCPAGYLATAVEQGDGQFKWSPATCDSAAGCSCGAPTGTAKCSLRMRYYDDNQCAGAESDDPTTLGGFTNCVPVDNEKYFKVESVVGGISCTPSGSATPSSKPAPSFGTTTIVCAPDPAVQTAQCKGDDVPLPAAKNAQACILVPMSASCAGGSYGLTRVLSKTLAFTDGRGCECQCSGDPSTSCTGGSVKTWSGFLCSGTPAVVAANVCRARGDDDDLASVDVAPTASAAPSCSARATPNGVVTPTWELKLCCLGSGGEGEK